MESDTMVDEKVIKALVGHEFPGGEYLIEHWENFLLTQCTGAQLMQNNVVHPVALFHVPIQCCNTSITEMFRLGHADTADSIAIESYQWEMPQPLKEDVTYKGSGKITEAARCKGGVGNIYDRIQFSFELTDPQGKLAARSIITWYYMRRNKVEKFVIALMLSIKKILPANAKKKFEATMIQMSGSGMEKMFPHKPTLE
jgi:hypothetical protein